MSKDTKSGKQLILHFIPSPHPPQAVLLSNPAFTTQTARVLTTMRKA